MVEDGLLRTSILERKEKVEMRRLEITLIHRRVVPTSDEMNGRRCLVMFDAIVPDVERRALPCSRGLILEAIHLLERILEQHKL